MAGAEGAPSTQRSTPPAAAARPREQAVKLDAHGTPDVYRALLGRLRADERLDEPIREPHSANWLAEREPLREMLARVGRQASWVPRAAELVLFVRNIGADEEIAYNSEAQNFMIFAGKTGAWGGLAPWEAGVVGQPAAEELQLDDLTRATEKHFQLNYSGFRVEALADPNSEAKKHSKQYKYVPLHHTRPFVLWKEVLRGWPEKAWHPTIRHALTVTATVSLLDKYHFRGVWPAADILCRGVYLGAELVLAGDWVRLLPRNRDRKVSKEIMRVSSIALKLSNLHAPADRRDDDDDDDDSDDDGQPYNSCVVVTGKAYSLATTLFATDAADQIPPGLLEYGVWCRLHERSARLQVPFHRIMGRCHDLEVMQLWDPLNLGDGSSLFVPAVPSLSAELLLNAGLHGTILARQYSAKHYLRIESGRAWFWADTRVEALDLGSLNACDVGRFDADRADPAEQREIAKLLQGAAASSAEEPAPLHKLSPAKTALGFRSSSSMVRSALQLVSDDHADRMDVDADVRDTAASQPTAPLPDRAATTALDRDRTAPTEDQSMVIVID